MVITHKDFDGKVIAYAEFRLVNERGFEDPKGIYIWINDVWVHKSFRTGDKFNEILKGFILSQADKFPWTEYIYWQRGKYDDRMSLYSRVKILRRNINGKEERGIHNSGSATGSGSGSGSDAV
jgi:hypothetical protein